MTAPDIRASFPFLGTPVGGRRLHYLDNAATTQIAEPVLGATDAYERQGRANVRRGVYGLAEAASAAFEDARRRVADYLNVVPAEIVFTGGATAAFNLVAASFGATLSRGDEIVISQAEHHANLVPWQMARDRFGIVLRVLHLDAEGRVDVSALDQVVTGRCRLIAVTHASNVTGAITNPAPFAAAARAVGARLLLDGCQMAPHGAVDIPALGCDFYIVSGHKMYGPTGIGALWARRALLESMPPFLTGGEMVVSVDLERSTFAPPPGRFEAGTPPITQAIGLGAACDFLAGLDAPATRGREMALTGRLLDGLSRLSRIRVLGPTGAQGRIGVVSFVVDGAHPHDVCQILDAHGVAVRGGHHCAQPLHAHFGVAGSVRASFAVYNEEADVDALLSGLEHVRAVFP